jgi:hypothetical protein
MTDGPEIDLGTPGGSARREYERRRQRREAATRDRHPRLGRLLLSFKAAPASETAWATGAYGEEALAGHLALRCPEVLVLHDRRMPRSRANLDHIAVTASGVHVIDAKRYSGRIEVRRPLFGDPRLMIAGRNKTKLVAGLQKQREAVRAALAAGTRSPTALPLLAAPPRPNPRRRSDALTACADRTAAHLRW